MPTNLRLVRCAPRHPTSRLGGELRRLLPSSVIGPCWVADHGIEWQWRLATTRHLNRPNRTNRTQHYFTLRNGSPLPNFWEIPPTEVMELESSTPAKTTQEQPQLPDIKIDDRPLRSVANRRSRP